MDFLLLLKEFRLWVVDDLSYLAHGEWKFLQWFLEIVFRQVTSLLSFGPTSFTGLLKECLDSDSWRIGCLLASINKNFQRAIPMRLNFDKPRVSARLMVGVFIYTFRWKTLKEQTCSKRKYNLNITIRFLKQNFSSWCCNIVSGICEKKWANDYNYDMIRTSTWVSVRKNMSGLLDSSWSWTLSKLELNPLILVTEIKDFSSINFVDGKNKSVPPTEKSEWRIT